MSRHRNTPFRIPPYGGILVWAITIGGLFSLPILAVMASEPLLVEAGVESRPRVGGTIRLSQFGRYDHVKTIAIELLALKATNNYESVASAVIDRGKKLKVPFALPLPASVQSEGEFQIRVMMREPADGSLVVDGSLNFHLSRDLAPLNIGLQPVASPVPNQNKP